MKQSAIKILLLLATALSVSPVAVIAQELADTAVTTLDGVSITARRNPVKVMTDKPLQTITANKIAELGIQDIADAVRRFAGTTVRDYGGIGGLKTVSVRNLGATHTAVSYDGLPVSNCQGGQIDIGRFSLDNVSTLSLAVGSADDMLQPASLYASGAVLSINTLPVFPDADRPVSAMVGIKGGSFGYISPMLRFASRAGRSTGVAVQSSFMRADGNYPFKIQNGHYVQEEKRNNSDIDTWHVEANMTHRFADESQLDVKAYYFYSRRGLPGAVTLYNPISTETLRDRNAFVQAKWRARFSEKWRFQGALKYNYGWNRDRELNPQFTGGVYQDTHRQDEYFMSAAATWQPDSPLTVALASDGIVNTLESTMAACPFPRRVSWLTTMAARWSRGPFTANASAVVSVIDEHVKRGEKPADVARINPSASVSIKPWSSELFFVRAMYKNSFRNPSFNDLYYERAGNRTLRPEKAHETGLGLTWSHRLIPAMDYFAVTADTYYNVISDKIVAFPTPYTWKMVNYGKVKAYGLDLTLATAFRLPAEISAEISGAYSLQRARNLSEPGAKEYGGQLPYTPLHSGNAAIVINTRWITLGYSVVASGKRYFMAQNIPANEIKAYAEQTLSLSRRFPIAAGTLDLRGEIVNLGNVSYEIIRFYPMPGRSWRLTASYKF